MIKKYRDDEDLQVNFDQKLNGLLFFYKLLQDFIDWVQRDWLKCCGINDPDDWNQNVYFECRKDDQWVESCGVPPSCCLQEFINNTQCGFGARIKDPNSSVSKKIYRDGCLRKGEEWFKFNILPISITIGCLAVLQVY